MFETRGEKIQKKGPKETKKKVTFTEIREGKNQLKYGANPIIKVNQMETERS